MLIDANVNDHTSCTINHESHIEEDENPLDRFRCAANEKTFTDTSHDNKVYLTASDENYRPVSL